MTLLALVGLFIAQLIWISKPDAGLLQSLTFRDWQIVKFTFFQAGLSTILSIVLGTAVAWSLHHQAQFPGRSFLIALFSSALVLPTLVVVLGLVSVLGRNGWLNTALDWMFGYSLGTFLYGFLGILIAHVYLNASFVVRNFLARLDAVPIEKRKLVRSLGLSSWQRFVLIEWPAIKSAIPASGITIFLLCFTSFAVVLTLGGSPRYNTLEVAIYEAVRFDFDIARALDLAVLQLLICAALVFPLTYIKNLNYAVSPRVQSMIWGEPTVLKIVQWTLITAACLGFILPLCAVIYDGIGANFVRLMFEPATGKALVTSLLIATASSMSTLAFALVLASSKRNFTLPHRLRSVPAANLLNAIQSFSALLYLAFPALVMGLSFFLVARHMPGSINFWAIIALLTANTLMALPFAIAILAPAMEKTAGRYDRLAFSLGVSGLDRWRLVEWPLLRAEIGYVCSIAFCFSLGDLGVIALFGSQDIVTLPWLLYQKFGSYRTDDAAGIALIMLALTLFVFLVVPKLFAGKSHSAGAKNAAH